MMEWKNCRNCGAPLKENGDCEYCGTKSPKGIRSSIEIGSDFIRMTCDSLAIGKAITQGGSRLRRGGCGT